MIKLKLDEVAPKVNDALHGNEKEDLESNLWSGMVSLGLVQGQPIPDPRLSAAIPMPEFARQFRYSNRPANQDAWLANAATEEASEPLVRVGD